MISGVRASSIRIVIHFVDDGKDVLALDHLGPIHFHVVAKIVEAEFVIRAVGHVARVSDLALFIAHVMYDAADREAEEAIDLPHPFRVALCQIVVDGDDVDAFACQRIQVDRQRRDQRFTFARFHLGDVALVKHHAADQLHIEMALAKHALGGFANRRKGRHRQIWTSRHP